MIPSNEKERIRKFCALMFLYHIRKMDFADQIFILQVFKPNSNTTNKRRELKPSVVGGKYVRVFSILLQNYFRRPNHNIQTG